MSMILNPYRYAVADRDFGNASREFDGVNDYVLLPSSLSSEFTGSNHTICAWVKLRSTGYKEPIVTQQYVGADVFAALGSLDSPYDQWSAGIYDGGWTFTGKSAATLNVWTHIASIYDGSNFKLYVNNVNSASVSASISPAASGNWFVGKHWSQDFFADALIADLRLFSSASSAEISAAYAGLSPIGNPAGWYFTDNDDVLDYSGNGNDGTNNGSTYSTDGPFD